MAGPRAIQLVYGFSFGLHVLGAAALSLIHVAPPKEVIVVEMQTIDKPKEEKKPEKPPEPAPVPKPAPHHAAPPPAPVAAPVAAPPPDFGFAMGSGDGPGGVAVGARPAPAPVAPRTVAHKVLAAAAPAVDSCGEEQVKPKALSMPHPSYTEEARAAGIEGKVRVELSIDARGQVTGARVIDGLGTGLDEAAVAALRAATFSPATLCGKAVPATFVVAVRFAL